MPTEEKVKIKDEEKMFLLSKFASTLCLPNEFKWLHSSEELGPGAFWQHCELTNISSQEFQMCLTALQRTNDCSGLWIEHMPLKISPNYPPPPNFHTTSQHWFLNWEGPSWCPHSGVLLPHPSLLLSLMLNELLATSFHFPAHLLYFLSVGLMLKNAFGNKSTLSNS